MFPVRNTRRFDSDDGSIYAIKKSIVDIDADGAGA